MSFLRNYLEYARHNEAPDMFHVWGGYVALSAAVSRRVWLPFGDEAIYPNLYVMLVGDAGNGKSVALRKTKRVIAELNPAVPISRSVETPEGLWRFMNGDPKANPPIASPVMFLAKGPDDFTHEVHPMTIIANEFINFIGKDQEGWTNALNDIYDEDKYEYRTKNKGEDNLIGPYIVLLGALTTEVSSDLQKARIISTGFARRTIFQYGERKWHDPHAIPDYDDTHKEIRRLAVMHANKLQTLNGPFAWDEETRRWWKQWYDDHTTQVPSHAPQVKSWYASKPTQVLKLAMLTSLSEGYDLRVTIPHFEVALAYLTEMERDLPKVFGGVGRNELAAVSLKIFDFVCGLKEPMAKHTLKQVFWTQCKPPNEFEDCIAYLVNTGQLAESVLQVKGQIGNVIATPAVMSAFAARVKLGPRLDEVQGASRSDSVPATGPSTVPQSVPVTKAELPTAVQSADGTEPAQPPA